MLEWGLHSGVNKDLSFVILRCDVDKISHRYFEDIVIRLKVGEY